MPGQVGGFWTNLARAHQVAINPRSPCTTASDGPEGPLTAIPTAFITHSMVFCKCLVGSFPKSTPGAGDGLPQAGRLSAFPAVVGSPNGTVPSSPWSSVTSASIPPETGFTSGAGPE